MTTTADRAQRWLSNGLVWIIVFGVALRGAVLLAGLPPTNSDEAFMGLMARHIADGRAAPVWFYGQEYMGTIEAWTTAPLFALFGSSTALLRLPNLAWYALLLVIVYHLTVRLYSRRLALLAVGLLALGSDRVFKTQLLAIGGYPEIVPMAAALFLLSVLLAGRDDLSRARRTGLFGLWGLIAGVALWDDWIILPYLAAAGLLLLVFRAREFVRLPGVAMVAGALAGASPMIYDNLAGNTNTWWWFKYLNEAGKNKIIGATVGDHLHGGVLVGIPMGTGMCLPSNCTPVHLWWGVVYLVLLGGAMLLAVTSLRRVRRRSPDGGDSRARVRHAGRLAIALGSALAIASYARSPAAVLHPIESARYLSVLVVALPVVLWPLLAWPARLRGMRITGRVGVAGIAMMAAVATVSTVTARPEARRQERVQAALIAELDRRQVTAVYSDYWTCGRLAFATRERIACATIEENLIRGHDRYLRYRARVDADPSRVYVMRRDWLPDRQFVAYVEQHRLAVTTTEVGDYRVYRSETPIDLPRPNPRSWSG